MKPVMRYHGAKYRIAHWVISHFPAHTTYVEPFGGAAGVLMQKPRSYSEVYNDLDGETVNVFRVLQDPDAADRLSRLLAITPYAREEFELSMQPTDEPVEKARRTLIRAHMGFGSAGATKGSTGFRIDSQRNYGTAPHLWSRYPDNIAEFVDRLRGVLIENRPAVEVLQQHDTRETLHYVDPPYLHSTRQMGNHRSYYRHEMSDDDHVHLLETLLELEGMVLVSGYDSDLYREALQGWHCEQFSARISAGRGSTTRTECLWSNPAAQGLQPQQTLFQELIA